MNLNVTMLRDYFKCPQLSYNVHVLRRGPARKSPALEVGGLFHEAMEMKLALLKSGSLLGVNPMDLPSWSTVSDESRAQWLRHKLWMPVNGFVPDPAWEIVATEIALEKDGIQGRLDAIVKWNSKFWSLQWKTYEDDLLGLQERVRLSWHEVAYQWLAQCKGYVPWGGTILGACQKLPEFRKVAGAKGSAARYFITDEDRINALTFHYLFRSPEKQAAMVADLLAWRRQAVAELETPPVRRNYDSCFGPFGRGRCPFFSVCHEGGSLEGPEFVTLEARY